MTRIVLGVALGTALLVSASAHAGGAGGSGPPTIPSKPLSAKSVAKQSARMLQRAQGWIATQGEVGVHATVKVSQPFASAPAIVSIKDASGKIRAYAQYTLGKKASTIGTMASFGSLDNSPSNRPYIEYIRTGN